MALWLVLEFINNIISSHDSAGDHPFSYDCCGSVSHCVPLLNFWCWLHGDHSSGIACPLDVAVCVWLGMVASRSVGSD